LKNKKKYVFFLLYLPVINKTEKISVNQRDQRENKTESLPQIAQIAAEKIREQFLSVL